MTFRELMEHELAWYKNIAKLKLLVPWKVKFRGKRLNVVVYKATPIPNAKVEKIRKQKYNRPIQYRIAVSYGNRILTSLIIDTKGSR